MSLAPARTSELIRSPLNEHLLWLQQHETQVNYHVGYCQRMVGPCLVVFCLDGRNMRRAYVTAKDCQVTSLMAFGLDEHEAIEVQKSVLTCDLKTRAAVLIVEREWKSGRLSFVEMEV